MSKNKAPAFQFYPSDFLADENVVLMSMEERGAYITLLCYCWREGTIPADVKKLAKFCALNEKRMAALWPAIKPCFSKAGERLYHKRLIREKKKQVEHRRFKSRAGKAGADARWQTHGTANGTAKVLPMAKNSSSSSSASASSSSPSGTSPLPPSLDTPRFRATWSDWVAYRREIKKSLKPTTQTKQLKKLATYGEAGAIERLERSMANGWTGFDFDPNGGGPAGKARGRSRPAIGTDDARRARIAELD